MNETVIAVENLGKKYRIRHQVRERHKTLRDLVARKVAKSLKWMATTATGNGNAHSQLPAVEDFWALQHIDFSVRKGEVVGLIGHNGAGKSTLLKILSRITEPSTGRIHIRGRVSSLLEVGTGFHPELTGRENVYLNGAILGMSRAEIARKFDEIVAFAEVEKFIDTPVKRYSSGMYLRLAFAVAAHLEPEILIVDEVLAVGDASFQRKCLGKMGEVAKGGRTVLFVSHNMTAIQGLCDRAIVFDRGHLLFDGEPKAAIDKYLTTSFGENGVESTGEYDLSQRTNEYSDRRVIIRKLEIRDSEGRVTNSLRMGEPAYFHVSLKGMCQYRAPQVGLIVKTAEGKWICSINSRMRGRFTDAERADEEIATLFLPRLPLTPDTYWITLSIAQEGIGRIDAVERAAKLVILENDVYGNGYRVGPEFGYFYLDGDWTIANQLHESTLTGLRLTSAR